MIKKRPLLVAALVFCLTATIFIVSSTGYDPWIDYDEDGTVDYDDFISLAGEYGTSGDPTKNVSVTNWPPIQEVAVINWPVREAITVWFEEPVSTASPLVSTSFYADGFGQLHLLMQASNLTGAESIILFVGAPLYDHALISYYPIGAAEFDMNTSTTEYAITMSVPSSEFYFWVYAGLATSCEVSLSFYLTWA